MVYSMNKVPIAEQIAAVEFEAIYSTEVHRNLLEAAAATPKWVERHQAELRVLGVFDIEAVTVREADHG
jgi:hypothetical protein